MRDIKFRGKRVDNGEWVFGYFLIDNWLEKPKYAIIPERDNPMDFNLIEVIPETIGQYTGLKDKNGKEIYEGDILRVYFDIHEIDAYVFINLTKEEQKNSYFEKTVTIPEFYQEPMSDNFEVIGSIHDNQVKEEIE